MKLRRWLFSSAVGAAVCAAAAPPAVAGGLFVPGSGAVSTSRAGAAIASTDDGEALSVNPAGLAKAGPGTVLTIGVTAIDYIMSFARRGTYDAVDDMGQGVSYAGQPYPTIHNTSHPPLGIGPMQPIPVVALVSDLGGAVPGLHVAIGLYAPNGYPFRKMTNVNGQDWSFDPAHFDAPPPPTRYDILEQEAAVILPTVAASYRITDKLDVGGRFSAGIATLKSQVAVWGIPLNYSEFEKQDGQVTINATDSFVPSWSLGATFRPTRNLEFAATYTSEVDIHAKGTAQSLEGPSVTLGTATPEIIPIPDGPNIRCAPGGTAADLKACVDLALPQTVTVGGRYKFLDDGGRLKGDIELDLDWENWGADPVSNYTVTIDGEVVTTQNPDPDGGIFLQQNQVRHGFQDTYAARLGGSYVIPVGPGKINEVTLRGGVSYDTAAAPAGWERVDLDGAARTTVAAGAAYQFNNRKTRLDLGFGLVLEGTVDNPGNCNPTTQMEGCAGTNQDAPVNQRVGPDPITPIETTASQTQNPVNQGIYKAHYIELMLGVTQRF
nr:outer membrane protein transport protein [Kofleriaceae bacterium]